jgi:hypothetical protein
VVDGDGSARRSSEWSCDAELERAARYVRDVRYAPTRATRLRAAASVQGLASVRALLRALPVQPIELSDGPAGQQMRAWFRPDRALPFDRAPIAVLDLPPSAAEYLRGRSRQALRTNLKKAAATGITCASLDSPQEVRRVADAIATGRRTVGEELVPLSEVPGPHRRFSAAYDATGEPLALGQTILDGPLAGLLLMLTAIDHPDARTGRYALHTHLVNDLVALGATRLVVGGSMLLTGEGTRYFQRRTGFTPVRVEVRAARHESAAVWRPVVGPNGLRRPAVRQDDDAPRQVAAVS